MAEEVKGLQGQRAQLLVGLGQLQKRLSMLGDCQARVATKRATLERCTGEKAAFQSSLVRCENRFLILETMEDRLRECELDTLACAKRKVRKQNMVRACAIRLIIARAFAGGWRRQEGGGQ